uniref:Uncharacterized protein n=1 Tax=Piliocolobus tephrosceles TaxID=591936 RepID=A0A8C9IGU1_9PRIM
MSVPVKQLEISIPQGYGLFIKTAFQASSFAEPLELQFQVHVEYLASSASPLSLCCQLPPYIRPPMENFPHSLCKD